jgi:sterol desaturase/sphingolipid hydroxylase (fatty acid hydroxylase superfamily)
MQRLRAQTTSFPWGWTLAAAAGLAAIAYAERKAPLRPRRECERAHVWRNLLLAGANGAFMSLVERPTVERLTHWVERRGVGLPRLLAVPGWARLGLALLVMDYSFYLWHRACHRFPGLYRLHAVHHADLDLDASTAIRFHLGEMLASAPVRAAQVLLAGLGPRDYAIWRRIFVLNIAFHHANWRLPPWLERLLSRVLVTPGLHHIHHSVDARERESNWSSGLVVWDQLHRTLRRQPRTAPIGDPAYCSERDHQIPGLLRGPLRRHAA